MEIQKSNLKSVPEPHVQKAVEVSQKEKPTASPRARVSSEERRQLIAKTAYYRAERRGFVPGSEWEDWFAAEQEVDKMLPKTEVRRTL